jgi:hypothetical protein
MILFPGHLTPVSDWRWACPSAYIYFTTYDEAGRSWYMSANRGSKSLQFLQEYRRHSHFIRYSCCWMGKDSCYNIKKITTEDCYWEVVYSYVSKASTPSLSNCCYPGKKGVRTLAIRAGAPAKAQPVRFLPLTQYSWEHARGWLLLHQCSMPLFERPSTTSQIPSTQYYAPWNKNGNSKVFVWLILSEVYWFRLKWIKRNFNLYRIYFNLIQTNSKW